VINIQLVKKFPVFLEPKTQQHVEARNWSLYRETFHFITT